MANTEISRKHPELGLAVVGAGYWGKNLIRNFSDLGVLKLVCDSNEVLLSSIQNQYLRVDISIAFQDILHRRDIDAVVVATPAETHFSLAREALLAGKHVFVEKPLTLHEEEGEEIIAIARKKRCTLMVGHLLQYHPVFIRLKEMTRAGELGRINYIYSHRLNLGKIRREENILWSFAPHDISMILTLAGEEPESILSTGGNYLHKRIADVTTTHLEFPSGMKAHIFVSWLHPFKDQKLVVVGDRKMAVFDDTQPWAEKLLLYPHEIRWQDNIPVPSKAEAERVEGIKELEPLRRECEHFVECISAGKTPLTDGREGLRVLRILNASQQSLDENGRKISLKSSAREIKEKSAAEKSPYFVHPTAVVDEKVFVGDGTKIWHFSHLLPGSRIGGHCNIGQNVVIGPDVTIGRGCKIQNNISIYKGVTLEDDVFCGPSMVFTNVYNPRAEIRKMDDLRPTLVKKGSTIGANSTIVCGNTVGEYSFIGAGAVVTKDVPAYALMAGNPAKRIGWVCRCGETLPKNLKCRACEKKYNLVGKKLSQK
jgi:predicted dehydrogenase/acetyltransferase-like isoleucine patch superfamily enzyme